MYDPKLFANRVAQCESLTVEEIRRWIADQEHEIKRLKDIAPAEEFVGVEELPNELRGFFLARPIEGGDEPLSSESEDEPAVQRSFVSKLLQIDGYGVLESDNEGQRTKRKKATQQAARQKQARVTTAPLADSEQLKQIERLFPLELSGPLPCDLTFVYHPRHLYDKLLDPKRRGARQKDEDTILRKNEQVIVLTPMQAPFRFKSMDLT